MGNNSVKPLKQPVEVYELDENDNKVKVHLLLPDHIVSGLPDNLIKPLLKMVEKFPVISDKIRFSKFSIVVGDSQPKCDCGIIHIGKYTGKVQKSYKYKICLNDSIKYDCGYLSEECARKLRDWIGTRKIHYNSMYECWSYYSYSLMSISEEKWTPEIVVLNEKKYFKLTKIHKICSIPLNVQIFLESVRVTPGIETHIRFSPDFIKEKQYNDTACHICKHQQFETMDELTIRYNIKNDASTLGSIYLHPKCREDIESFLRKNVIIYSAEHKQFLYEMKEDCISGTISGTTEDILQNIEGASAPPLAVEAERNDTEVKN